MRQAKQPYKAAQPFRAVPPCVLDGSLFTKRVCRPAARSSPAVRGMPASCSKAHSVPAALASVQDRIPCVGQILPNLCRERARRGPLFERTYTAKALAENRDFSGEGGINFGKASIRKSLSPPQALQAPRTIKRAVQVLPFQDLRYSNRFPFRQTKANLLFLYFFRALSSFKGSFRTSRFTALIFI